MKTGTAESYAVFVRDWWKYNGRWPDHREPYPGAPRRYIARHCTEKEAQEIARTYNATHEPGWRSRKAEYEHE